MNDYPNITCRCNTFGRKAIEESIHCFLEQDYPGKKELLILNDNPDHTFKCNYKEVTVYNKEPYAVLGEKYNDSVRLAKYDVLMTWDDDDIFMPWTLTSMLENWSEEHGYGFFRGYYVSEDNETLKYSEKGIPQGITMYTRDAWNKAGRYPSWHKAQGNDKHLNANFSNYIRRTGPLERIHRWKMYLKNLKRHNNFFIYRPNNDEMFKPWNRTRVLKPKKAEIWQRLMEQS